MTDQKTVCYFETEKTFFKWFGVSLTENEGRTYSIYTKLYYTFVVSYALLISREILCNEIDAYIDYLTYYFCVYLEMAQLTTLLYSRLELGRMLEKFQKTPCLPNVKRGGDAETKLFDECIFVTKVQALLYYVGSFGTVACTILYSIYRRLSSSDYHRWVLPYGPVTILDTTRSPYFELTLFYQTMFAISGTIITITSDVLIASILVHITYQFKNLQNYLERVVKITHQTDFEEYSNLDNMMEVAQKIPWKYLQKSLSRYLKYHLTVIDIAQEMERIFSGLLFFIYLGSIGLLCFEIYRLTVLTNYLQVARTVVEIVIFMVQIGIVSYWGEQVIYHSQAIAYAAYKTDFVGTDLRFQKALLLIMMRSQRPVKLTAGKFAYIQIFTFTWVIKTTYTLFMVLRKTQK